MRSKNYKITKRFVIFKNKKYGEKNKKYVIYKIFFIIYKNKNKKYGQVCPKYLKYLKRKVVCYGSQLSNGGLCPGAFIRRGGGGGRMSGHQNLCKDNFLVPIILYFF